MSETTAVSSAAVPLEQVFPSIALWPLARVLESFYESIPIGFGSIKLSYLLFVPPTIPLVVGMYFIQKALGSKYVITTRSVRRVKIVGSGVQRELPLEEIHSIEIPEQSRSVFYRTGDIRLNGPMGDTLLLLPAIPYPDRVAALIRETKFSREQVDAAAANLVRRAAAASG